ncbi:MAG: hypothetical protein MSS69_09765 [Spirochaetales bacterium]|nr:hypothetical protein [Spirochaetales bacterium]
MKKIKFTKALCIRIIAILLVILLAVVMFIIGKQHKIYFDNKDWGPYKAYQFVEVSVDKQDSVELAKRDRDVFTVVAQGHTIYIDAMGDEKEVKIHIPLFMKNVLINIPALMNGEDQDVWMEEFIVETVSVSSADEVVVTDETAGLMGD